MAYVALRNRAPIVPLVLGGNEELYFGRRILLRVLPALDPMELAGLSRDDALPEPGSSAERRATRLLTDTFAARVAAAVAEVHAVVRGAAGHREAGSLPHDPVPLIAGWALSSRP
jgi:hypothetical protein